MARYATSEEQYQCPQCTAFFALRECKQIGSQPRKQPMHECPCCKDTWVTFITLDDGPVTMWGSRSGRIEMNRNSNLLYRTRLANG